MSARYWVLCSDELMSEGVSLWPAFMRPVRRDDSSVPPDNHSHWWLFEDDEAPAELDGKKVELIIATGQEVQDGPYVTAVQRKLAA
jgi:hypothetical protein